MKLNVLLALTDTLRTKYKGMVTDYTKFFSKSQGSFKGEKRTYDPADGTIDEPNRRNYTKVVTTVNEKFDYFMQESAEFINALFSQEKTNASNLAVGTLKINDQVWGQFTSLELLRLKSLLESGDLGNVEAMLSTIPVRSDSENWNASNEFTGRDVFETDQSSGEVKTTTKEDYILVDPNIKHLKEGGNYTPMTAVKNTISTLGKYTRQQFSGEWSHTERAFALKRKNDLLAAVIVALKEANDCKSIESELTADKIFGFIFYDK
jgi:hypothetical protein